MQYFISVDANSQVLKGRKKSLLGRDQPYDFFKKSNKPQKSLQDIRYKFLLAQSWDRTHAGNKQQCPDPRIAPCDHPRAPVTD